MQASSFFFGCLEMRFGIAYVDGSYFEQGDFAGSSVYFSEESPLNLVQYLPLEYKREGDEQALRAEIYASVLAIRQAYENSITYLLIKQDCKEAIKFLSDIDHRLPLSVLQNRDPLVVAWWNLRQYITVHFEWIKAHSHFSDPQQSQMSIEDFLGNFYADKLAKKAANLNRYTQECKHMDACNPLKKPFVPFRSRPLPDSFYFPLYLKTDTTNTTTQKLEKEKNNIKELIEGWLAKNNNTLYDYTTLAHQIEALEQREWKHEAIARLPPAILSSMWQHDHIRLRLFANHHPTRTLFAQLSA